MFRQSMHFLSKKIRFRLTPETLPAWLYIGLPLIGLYDLTQETYLVEIAGIVLTAAAILRLYRRAPQTLRWTTCDVLLTAYFLLATGNGGFTAPIRIQDNGLLCGMMYLYARLLASSSLSMPSVALFLAGGLLQVCIAVLQQAGIVASLHNDFTVTGSFGNPGPLACYLCTSFLIGLTGFYALRSQHAYRPKYLFFVPIAVILLYGLYLADSRTAWLASGCGWMSIPVLRQRTASARRKGLVICSIAALSGTLALYTYRSISADARILIWKAGSSLFIHHPLTGTGTNGFASNYMPAQGTYLENAGPAERLLASDNQLAYNEWLRTGCEQGIIGLLLLGIPTCLLLYKASATFRLSNNPCFPPLIGWLVFSCFSYPTAEPALSILFPLFLGLTGNATFGPARNAAFSTTCRILYPCLITAAVFFAYNCTCRYRANQHLASFFFEEETDGEYMPPENKSFIFRDTQLLRLYTTVWMINEYYPQALQGMQTLQTLSPSVQLLLDEGLCLEATGRQEQAVAKYRTAIRWVPGLLTPRFRLFMAYKQQGDTLTALKLAQDVIQSPVKQEDDRTFQMREIARSFIHSQQTQTTR